MARLDRGELVAILAGRSGLDVQAVPDVQALAVEPLLGAAGGELVALADEDGAAGGELRGLDGIGLADHHERRQRSGARTCARGLYTRRFGVHASHQSSRKTVHDRRAQRMAGSPDPLPFLDCTMAPKPLRNSASPRAPRACRAVRARPKSAVRLRWPSGAAVSSHPHAPLMLTGRSRRRQMPADPHSSQVQTAAKAGTETPDRRRMPQRTRRQCQRMRWCQPGKR